MDKIKIIQMQSACMVYNIGYVGKVSGSDKGSQDSESLTPYYYNIYTLFFP